MTTFPLARRGSTYRHQLQIAVTSGSIADCILRMMVKSSFDDADAAALVSIDNDLLGGITIVSAVAPIVIEIEIGDSVMASLPTTGTGSSATRFVAGIQIELPDGTTEEIEELDPSFYVKADIVRAVASP